MRQKITFDYFLRREGNYIENCFSTIEGLPIGFNCTEVNLASQNLYGFRIYFEAKKIIFTYLPRKEGYNIENCFSTVEGLHIGFNFTEGILASQT